MLFCVKYSNTNQPSLLLSITCRFQIGLFFCWAFLHVRTTVFSRALWSEEERKKNRPCLCEIAWLSRPACRIPENRFLPPPLHAHVPKHNHLCTTHVFWAYVNDYTLDACACGRGGTKREKKPNSIAKPQRKIRVSPSTKPRRVHVRYRFVIVAGPRFKSISRSRTFQRRPAVRFARRPPPSPPGNNGGRKLFWTVFII